MAHTFGIVLAPFIVGTLESHAKQPIQALPKGGFLGTSDIERDVHQRSLRSTQLFRTDR